VEHAEFGGDSESSFFGRRAIVITVVQRQFGSMHSPLACIDIYSRPEYSDSTPQYLLSLEGSVTDDVCALYNGLHIFIN
jgi:hypothetical protein